MGVPVISPTEARAAFPSATVIITTRPGYIEEIRSQLAGMGWTQICDCAHLLSSFEYGRNSFASGVSALHFDLDGYFYEYFVKYFPEKLIIPSIDIVITEKCSLRCRDCANLMQYYTHPQDVDFGQLFSSLDLLMQCVDHVLEFRILGGETFMNRRAHQYVERLRQYGNYTRIAVYSNGTIVPREENLQCLTCDDTYLRVSDYGPLSRKVQEMAKEFDAHRVSYDVLSVSGWQDCSVIVKRERTPEELEGIFSCCCANKTFTLLNGTLYICPFAANADNLGALPLFSKDSLKMDGHLSKQEMRGWIFNMLRNKTYLSACEYCAGRPVGVTLIPAAVQVASPLPYKRLCQGDA